MAPPRADVPPTMVPVVFQSCFGWFHPPAEAVAARRGVVLCPPFGHDAVCTGRGWRVLADMLAASGLPVLRFDYPGTGDSAGEEAPGRLDAWIASIHDAAAWLRAQAGAAEIALCGLRVGADLAAAAAARRPREATALALLAPTGSGRAWRRQLLLGASGGNPEAADPEWLETAGFRLHRSDLDAAARALDLGSALIAADAPRVLVAAPARLPGPEACARLRDAGVALEHRGFEGLTGFLRDAQLSVVPRAAFAEVTRWLRDGALPATAPCRLTTGPAVLPLENGAEERLLHFGAGSASVGVLCEPSPGRVAAGAPAVLLPNTGANGRAGNGRVAVRLARRLAAAGVASLRMDAADIGDGGVGDAADDPPDTYHPRLVRDVAAALDLLESRGFAGTAIAGVCSGAHAAFQTAVGDARVRGLVLVNLPPSTATRAARPRWDGGPPPGERPALRPSGCWRAGSRRNRTASAPSASAGMGLDRAGAVMRSSWRVAPRWCSAYRGGRPRPARAEGAFSGAAAGPLSRLGAVCACVVLRGADHSLLPRAMQEESSPLVEETRECASAGARPRRAARPPTEAAVRSAPCRRRPFAALLRRPSPQPPHHAG
jgi:alpha/beta superfamily hydrolase